MVFRQALLETRAIQAEVPTKLVGKFSLILCSKAFPQSLSEGYTIYNLPSCNANSTTESMAETELINSVLGLDATNATTGTEFITSYEEGDILQVET